jgi:hypothetical protein
MGGLFAVTTLLTRFWYVWPATFPSFLKDIGNALISAFGVESAEVAADFELLFVFAVSALLILALYFAARRLWRRFQPAHDDFQETHAK